jgi:hypothetical protein
MVMRVSASGKAIVFPSTHVLCVKDVRPGTEAEAAAAASAEGSSSARTDPAWLLLALAGIASRTAIAPQLCGKLATLAL